MFETGEASSFPYKTRCLMNPDKLFDYLDGKLSPADREQLEERLMSDAQLRQQFNIAREIHRSGSGKREVIVPSEDHAAVERSGILTRRIAVACAALVFINVLVGIAVIVGKNRKKQDFTQKEAGIRQQLNASLGAAAQNALPPPTFESGEILLTVPRADWENVAARIIAAATSFDGSATKGLPADDAMTVLADIPSAREKEFRQAITSAATISPMPAVGSGTATSSEPSPNAKTIVQVRIAEAAR